MATKNIKKYIQAKGRRKSAVARIRIFSGEGEMTVNDLELKTYFSDVFAAAPKIRTLLKKANLEGKVNLSFRVKGGGKNSQLGAVIHSLARALLLKDEGLRKSLRDEGYLTRDPRMKERKKYGLKRARRAPQWQKR